MRSVDQAKGRFRSFLLATLQYFLSHERERATALKRGGGTFIRSLDANEAEGRYQDEPTENITPEQLFERRWGLTVMERAMERLESEARSPDDRGDRFARLKSYLTGSEPKVPYEEVGEELGMSVSAVKSAVHRMRQSYGRLLREEIARTVAGPEEVDDEVRHLLSVVRPWRA